MRIVLADNRSEVRAALRLLIQHRSALQVVGETGDMDGVRGCLDAAAPDLLLVEWKMLGRLPAPVLADLHAHYPRLRVIVMSGHPGARLAALEAGADAFVSKTNPPEQLLEVLDGCRAEQD